VATARLISEVFLCAAIVCINQCYVIVIYTADIVSDDGIWYVIFST